MEILVFGVVNQYEKAVDTKLFHKTFKEGYLCDYENP